MEEPISLNIRKPETGDVDVMDLTPACGVACCIASCFTVWPDCLGCSGNQTYCCMSCDMIGFKKSKDPDAYCLCVEGTLNCIPVRVCLKVRRSKINLK